jgi:N-acetyltransferase 10
LPTPSRDVNDLIAWTPAEVSLEDDLQEAGDEVMMELREKQKDIINSLHLDQYAIGGDEEDWKKVKINGGSNRVSIANSNSSKKRKMEASKGLAEGLGF